MVLENSDKAYEGIDERCEADTKWRVRCFDLSDMGLVSWVIVCSLYVFYMIPHFYVLVLVLSSMHKASIFV